MPRVLSDLVGTGRRSFRLGRKGASTTLSAESLRLDNAKAVPRRCWPSTSGSGNAVLTTSTFRVGTATSFSSAPMPDSAAINTGVWAHGMFFLGGIPATGTVGLYRSVDGFSWSRVDAVSLFVSVIATGGGRTVVVSSGGAPISVAVTTNGYQWSYGTMQFGSVAGIAYGNGVFIAVTPTAAECAVSSDGLSWTTYSTPAATTGICFGNGVFLIMAAGAIYTSTNGSSWTYIGAASGECWNPMYVDGVFFIHNGSNGTITAYSPSEGIFQCEVPQAAYWYRAAYGNGVYYAGAAAWADSTKRLLYSENGYDWFPVTGFNGSVGALVYGNGRIIAAPYTSGDPIHTAGYCIDSSVIA